MGDQGERESSAPCDSMIGYVTKGLVKSLGIAHRDRRNLQIACDRAKEELDKYKKAFPSIHFGLTAKAPPGPPSNPTLNLRTMTFREMREMLTSGTCSSSQEGSGKLHREFLILARLPTSDECDASDGELQFFVEDDDGTMIEYMDRDEIVDKKQDSRVWRKKGRHKMSEAFPFNAAESQTIERAEKRRRVTPQKLTGKNPI